MSQINLIKRIVFSTMLIVAFFIAGCKKESTNPIVNNPDYTGNWKVSMYWDNVDETSDFVSYTFTFGSGNVLTAEKAGGATATGTWTQTSNNLIIDFGADPVLSELNDDWQIVEKTATTIKLKDDNPAQDDRLEFIKL